MRVSVYISHAKYSKVLRIPFWCRVIKCQIPLLVRATHANFSICTMNQILSVGKVGAPGCVNTFLETLVKRQPHQWE